MQAHKDPIEVHRENMKLLKVLPASGNRSAPNSPFMRRAAEKNAENTSFLSPSPHRKDFKHLSDDERSKSWMNLAATHSSNLSPKGLSPKESPVGSPMTVSEKIIRTHFLSNTTGKAGSYLLQRSDDIIKQKDSPFGSPRIPSSPNVTRKNDITSTQTSTRNHTKLGLSVPATIPVVVSADADQSNVGFTAPAKDAELSASPKNTTVIATGTNPLDDDESDEEEKRIEDVRKSIGSVLRKSKQRILQPVVSNECSDQKKEEFTEQEKFQITQSNTVKKIKPKRHHYIKYGNTNLSPGYLTAPNEPRGSKDLSAEMEIWERKQRRRFEDLEYVEEDSSCGQSDKGEPIDGERKIGPAGVYMMPPVSENIAHIPAMRDFSIPVDAQGDIDDETWEEMKRCRYLRFQEEEDQDNSTSSDNDNEESEESLNNDE